MNYGRYQIVGELGKGSMGVVYQAHDPQIDRLVALKALRQDRLTSEDFVHRFLKEAKAIGRLSHPNIVTVYDVGEDHGTIYIAMEFLEGKPLNKVIEEKRLSLKEIINLGIQAAETLDYAHQKGIVHRDIKPGNILVQASGQIKITDFGIAHIEDPSASVQTQAGEILGTPAYMSPEQVMSRPVDGRSDLFSLGIILYELTIGKRPFGGENLAAIFNAITQETLSQPTKANPDIPQGLSQIIMKCLNKKPDERFQTGKALAEALRESLKIIEPTAVEFTPKPKKSRNMVFLIIGTVIFLGILGGLSYIYLIPNDKTPTKVEKIKSGSLKVESIPEGAQLFVDGTFKGQTPTKLDLPAGKHEIRLTLPDHHDWEAQVQLKEEGETPLMIRLIPISKSQSETIPKPQPKTIPKSQPETIPKPQPEKQEVSGTYIFVKDSDGKVPGNNSTINLILADGQAKIIAIKPDDNVTDKGQYKIVGERITMKFEQMDFGTENKPFTYDGKQLILPFKVLSDGEGTSTWVKK